MKGGHHQGDRAQQRRIPGQTEDHSGFATPADKLLALNEKQMQSPAKTPPNQLNSIDKAAAWNHTEHRPGTTFSAATGSGAEELKFAEGDNFTVSNEVKYPVHDSFNTDPDAQTEN